MCDIFNFIHNPSFHSFFSAIVGAAIGGFATFKTTEKAYKNNQKLESEKLHEYEKATALSIIEELSVLKNSYEEEMDKEFLDLTEDQYLTTYYTVTQDFFTVFTQNAGEIGLISNKNLRQLIVTSYINLKRYLEECIIYKNKLDEFEANRNNFIARAYPTLINSACSKANTNAEIDLLIDKVNNNDWTWLNSQYLNQAQVMNFFNSDKATIDNLIYLSQALKNRYYDLKKYINNAIEKGLDYYKE